jgi:hypothetical protein
MPVIWYALHFDEPGKYNFNTFTAETIADEGRAHDITANPTYVTIV